MNNVMEINAADFAANVLNSPLPVLVDFFADWCPPCKLIAPLFEELAAEFSGRVRFVKIDAEEANELAQQFGVESIPTLLVFQQGQVTDRKVGACSRSDLQAMVEKALPASG
jgi:thioredoxin 1